MGWDRHHAIVVTAFRESDINSACEMAHTLFHPNQVSPIQKAPINDWWTFFVGPDGSKEGWSDSDAGDEARTTFIGWLRLCESAGDFYVDWAVLQYGDDAGVCKVVSHRDDTPTPANG